MSWIQGWLVLGLGKQRRWLGGRGLRDCRLGCRRCCPRLRSALRLLVALGLRIRGWLVLGLGRQCGWLGGCGLGDHWLGCPQCTPPMHWVLLLLPCLRRVLLTALCRLVMVLSHCIRI